MDEKKLKSLLSVTKSATITIAFIAIITMVADLAPKVKAWLASTFTHHWIGKGILSLALFVILAVIFCLASKSVTTPEKLSKSLKNLYLTTAISSLVIFLFFVWEAFLK